jgi:hypothetical protein
LFSLKRIHISGRFVVRHAVGIVVLTACSGVCFACGGTMTSLHPPLPQRSHSQRRVRHRLYRVRFHPVRNVRRLERAHGLWKSGSFYSVLVICFDRFDERCRCVLPQSYGIGHRRADAMTQVVRKSRWSRLGTGEPSLAARGESLASHRDERGAPPARRDD